MFGAGSRTRTHHPRLTKPLLYQMSYSSLEAGTGFEPVMLQAYETAVVTTLPAIRARRVRTLALYFKLNHPYHRTDHHK